MIFDKSKRRRALYKEVFNSEAGKEVLEDILRCNFVLNTTMQDTDPLQIAFNEGRRAVVLAIMNHLQITPVELMEKQREVYDRISTDNREQSLNIN
ncbi:MAG: hypothetical protein CMB80_01380 [Flammeovirgaceae bacterium]|nr:hypothetical protein [Flammeovirgaceae bacterium]